MKRRRKRKKATVELLDLSQYLVGIDPGSQFSGGYTFSFSSTGSAPKLKPPKEIEDLGLAIEPVVGWRGWALNEVDGRWRLSAATTSSVWVPGEPHEATCRVNHSPSLWGGVSAAPLSYYDKTSLSRHDAPGDRCTCGIYAWEQESKMPKDHGVYGQVALWGKVLICEHGYRAEYGYPKSLVIKGYGPKAAGRAADQIREDYRIPVEVLA